MINVQPVERSRKRPKVQMRQQAESQDYEPGTEGVSESQMVWAPRHSRRPGQ